MATYEVYRGVDRTVEVKGFTLQYLLMLVGCLLLCFVVYAVLFVIGVSLMTTSVAVLALLFTVFYGISWANRKLGRKGLAKLRAGMRQPNQLSRRQSVRGLLSSSRGERYGR